MTSFDIINITSDINSSSRRSKNILLDLPFSALLIKNMFTVYILRGVLFMAVSIALMTFGVQGAQAFDFSVSTESPTKKTVERTIINARLQSSTNDAIWIWFEYGKNGRYENKTDSFPVFRNDSFSRSLHNLEEGEIYIYRAVAKKQKTGERVYGKAKYFFIPKDKQDIESNVNDSTASDINTQIDSSGTKTIVPVASVGGRTFITDNTATLKGIVITGGSGARGWFEWGHTRSLGNETVHQKLSLTTDQITITDTITGLVPNTTYYYRTVAQTTAGTSKGTVTSFKTTSTGFLGGLFNKEETNEQMLESQNVSIGYLKTKTTAEENSALMQTSSGKEKQTTGALGWGRVLREQFFFIDKEGNITASQEVFAIAPKKGLANVFTSGIFSFGGILPDTMLGWLAWLLIIFVSVTQLRRALLNRRKEKEEQQQREEEMKELRRYQDTSLSLNKEKQPA